MGTPISAETSAASAQRLQKEAIQGMQGSEAIYGGKGGRITVTSEQSGKIMGVLQAMRNELVAKRPEDLTIAEQQILALINKIGENGQVDGKEACQALLLLQARRNAIENGPRGRTRQEKQTTKKRLNAVTSAQREIAVNIIPAEVGVNRFDRWVARRYTEGKMDAKFLAGNIDADRMVDRHPIIQKYEDLITDKIASGMNPREASDSAMSEAIQYYGDNEVDKLMQQIEAENRVEMTENQRREAHASREQIQEQLEQGREDYEERKGRVSVLKKNRTELVTQKQKLEDDLDDLDSQIALLPNTDIPALEQALEQARDNVSDNERDIQTTQIEIDILRKKIESAKSAAEKPADTSAIETQIQDLVHQKGEAEKNASTANASESQEKTTITNARRDAKKYSEEAADKKSRLAAKSTETAQTVRTHEAMKRSKMAEMATITDPELPTKQSELQGKRQQILEVGNNMQQLADTHSQEVNELLEQVNNEKDPDKKQELLTQIQEKQTAFKQQTEQLSEQGETLKNEIDELENDIESREQAVKSRKDLIKTDIDAADQAIDQANQGLEDYKTSIEDLEQKAQAELQKADEAQRRIDSNKITSAEQNAVAKQLGEQIALLNQKLKELQKQRGSLTKAEVDGFIDQEETLRKKVETLKIQKARNEQIIGQKQEALRQGQEAKTKKDKMIKERDDKKRDYDKTDKQITRIDTEIANHKTETDKYEDIQKQLAGVEKRVQSAERASTEAKKLLEAKTTKKADIERHFGFKPGDISDQEYIDAVNAVFPDQAATIGNDLGRAQRQMESSNELSLWKVLMRIFAGATVV